jgi:hypothetical protein
VLFIGYSNIYYFYISGEAKNPELNGMTKYMTTNLNSV